jgi:hypothetical protein
MGERNGRMGDGVAMVNWKGKQMLKYHLGLEDHKRSSNRSGGLRTSRQRIRQMLFKVMRRNCWWKGRTL